MESTPVAIAGHEIILAQYRPGKVFATAIRVHMPTPELKLSARLQLRSRRSKLVAIITASSTNLTYLDVVSGLYNDQVSLLTI